MPPCGVQSFPSRLGTFTITRGLGLGAYALFRKKKLGAGVPYFNTFFLKEPLRNTSLYFFLPGYFKAQ